MSEPITYGDITANVLFNENRGTKPNKNFANGKAAGVTLHETANLFADANANARYFASPRTRGASVHFFVDGKPLNEGAVWQSLAVTEQSWHAGDGYNGPGNQTTIAIEVCVDADVEAAWRNTIALVRELRAGNHIGDGVYFHQHWSGKLCPALLLQRPDVYQDVIHPVEKRRAARAKRQPRTNRYYATFRAGVLQKAGLTTSVVTDAIRAADSAPAPAPTEAATTSDTPQPRSSRVDVARREIEKATAALAEATKALA